MLHLRHLSRRSPVPRRRRRSWRECSHLKALDRQISRSRRAIAGIRIPPPVSMYLFAIHSFKVFSVALRIYTLLISLFLPDFREKGLDNAALDPDSPKAGTSLRHPPNQSTQDPRYSAPAPAEPGNICLQPFPPPVDPVDIGHAKAILRTGAVFVSALCFLVWISVATGKKVSWLQFLWRSALVTAVAGVAWIAVENAGRKVEKEVERVRMQMHRQRGESLSPPTPESVEWLNALLKVVWGLINPDMFVPYVDVRIPYPPCRPFPRINLSSRWSRTSCSNLFHRSSTLCVLQMSDRGSTRFESLLCVHCLISLVTQTTHVRNGWVLTRTKRVVNKPPKPNPAARATPQNK